MRPCVTLEFLGFITKPCLSQALSDSLKDQPGRLIAKKLDLTKQDEVVDLFKTIEEELGGVDVLVNNAAVLVDKPIHGKIKFFK